MPSLKQDSNFIIVAIGVITAILSLVFLGVGMDSLVEAFKGSRHDKDFVSLSSVYGLLSAFSLLYGIASVCLSIAGSRNLRMYFLPWILLNPLWTVITFISLVVMPASVPSAVTLSDSTSRISGAVVVGMISVATLVYASYAFYNLYRKKKKPVDAYKVDFQPKSEVNEGSVKVSTISGFSIQMEVKRKEKSKRSAAVAAAKQRDEMADEFNFVSEDIDQGLTNAQQLTHSERHGGLDNPAFLTNEDICRY